MDYHQSRSRGMLVAAMIIVVITASLVGILYLRTSPTAVSTTTVTTTILTPTTSNVTTTVFAFPGYINLSASGVCTGPGGYEPCWGGAAYLFDCANAAATQQGCTQQVVTTLSNQVSPTPSYVISIRYPFYNQTVPSWANCLWTVQGITPGQGYAYCTLVNSASFLIGEQAPPHP